MVLPSGELLACILLKLAHALLGFNFIFYISICKMLLEITTSCSFFWYFWQLFYVSLILNSSSSDLFSRTENLKICYKVYYQEAKDTLFSHMKTRIFTVRMQDTNFFVP